jgi:maleylacetate reductase
MQSGTMVFTQVNRVSFGQPAAATMVAEAERLGAKRVFLLTGRTLNRDTDEEVRRGVGDPPRGILGREPANDDRIPAGQMPTTPKLA